MSESSQGRAHGLQRGERIDAYKVIRHLGRGGMGDVYVARDTRLGRRVALKLIRPERLATLTARRQFLQEARATARVSHPNIVTIYAVGEHGDQTYLALEYLPGQNLRARLDEGRLGVVEAIRLGVAVASAVAAAHRRNVLHRDLKPENVLIPRDGRPRVVDFGLARSAGLTSSQGMTTTDSGMTTTDGVDPLDVDTLVALPVVQSGKHHGTPGYMAPELWREEQEGAPADVWALGLVLHELITGAHPYRSEDQPAATLAFRITSDAEAPLDPSLADAGGAVADVVARCLHKDPARRPSAVEVAELLERALDHHRGAPREGDDPFRGLEPFGEQHAGMFFGRDAEIATFLERLRSEPVLPVVGPSGAGKSSFVRAGVLPRLREQRPWSVLAMRPGARPLYTLAGRLLRGAGASTVGGWSSSTGSGSSAPWLDAGGVERTPASLAAALRERPQLAALLLQQRAESERAPVLLFVDQLEEVFTLVGRESERQAFLRAVCTAADDPEGPVRVVFTVRDDFLGRLALGAEVREALGRVSVLRSPGEDALREIVSRPLVPIRYGFDDPSLPDTMVADVRGEAAPLPLLQFALRTLWERRDRRRRLLLRDVYHAMGGVAGALAEHADGVLGGLAPAQLRLARAMLLRLVTRGPGDGSTGAAAAGGGAGIPGFAATRRALPRGEVIEGLGAGAAEVLDVLVRGRLLTARRAAESDDTLLELAHESLLVHWGQLRRWIADSGEELTVLAEVGEAAELWRKRGMRRDEAWHGEALAEARRTIQRLDLQLPEHVQAFLAAGEALEHGRARRRRLLVGAGVLALAAAALVLLGVNVALGQKEREAQHQRQRAESGRAAALREGARAALARGNPLEARAKLRAALEIEDAPLARALWWQLRSDPLYWDRQMGAYVEDMAYSPDGRTLAVGGADRAIHLIDTRTGAERLLRGHADKIWSVAYAPDGRALASGSWSGEVRVWDPATGDHRVFAGHDGAVRSVAFSPDGGRLASSGYDGTIRVWWLDEGDSAEPRVLDTGGDSLRGVAFSPDGLSLACGSRTGTVRVWDLTGDDPPRELHGHHSVVRSVAFLPDGQRLVSAGIDATVRVWTLADGGVERILEGHSGKIYALALHPTLPRAYTAGVDQQVWQWDLEGDTPAVVVGRHERAIYDLAMHPDGRLLAASDLLSRVRVWDLSVRSEPTAAAAHDGPIYSLAADPRGRWIASGGKDNTVRLWDRASGEQRAVFEEHDGVVSGLAFSPDGARLVSTSWDGTIRVQDVGSGTQRELLRGLGAGLHDLEVFSDGVRVVTAGGEGGAQLWDLARGVPLRTFAVGPNEPVLGVAASPDGRRLAYAGGGTIRVHDADDGRLVHTLDAHTDMVRGLVFGPDGSWLASAGRDGRVLRWDLARGTAQTIDEGHGRAYHIDVHPDGRRLGVPYADGLARIWDLDGGAVVTLRGHRDEVNALRFTGDGERIVTASDDGTVRLWEADSGRPAWRAPLLTADPPTLATHMGWQVLEHPAGESGGVVELGGAWRAAIDDRARLAGVSPDGKTVCLASGDGVELWDVQADTLLQRSAAAGVEQLVARDEGCVVRVGETVRLLRPGGDAGELGRRVQALAADADGVLMATVSQVELCALDGSLRAEFAGGVDVTALTRVGDELVLGFADGSLERVVAGDASAGGAVDGAGGGAPRQAFFDTPGAAVESLCPGPPGTVVAGYADGQVGLWELRTGARLHATRLHGPAVHLLLRDRTLYVASELGDHRELALDTFYEPYCALLATVWDEMPAVWENGVLVLREPGAEHVCAGGD